MEHFTTIGKESFAEFKDRGSKFLAHAFPISSTEEFKTRLQELKKEHPKAAHHCFAYRLGIDGNSFRVNDDGEPSGTAGKPILGQIDSKQLTDVAVVVIRYFGGTLLGVPGLINAYKTATSLALQITPLVQKQVEKIYTVEFDYTRINEIMMLIKQYQCSIISQENQLFSVIRIGIPINRISEVVYKLGELEGVHVNTAVPMNR
jgi:uncharacterized YigZ family protein